MSIQGQRIMRPKTVKDIPTVVISGEQFDTKLQCVICLEAFKKKEKAQQLLCQHIFHGPCIAQWLQNRSTCPSCRTIVIQEREYISDEIISISRFNLINSVGQSLINLYASIESDHSDTDSILNSVSVSGIFSFSDLAGDLRNLDRTYHEDGDHHLNEEMDSHIESADDEGNSISSHEDNSNDSRFSNEEGSLIENITSDDNFSLFSEYEDDNSNPSLSDEDIDSHLNRSDDELNNIQITDDETNQDSDDEAKSHTEDEAANSVTDDEAAFHTDDEEATFHTDDDEVTNLHPDEESNYHMDDETNSDLEEEDTNKQDIYFHSDDEDNSHREEVNSQTDEATNSHSDQEYNYHTEEESNLYTDEEVNSHMDDEESNSHTDDECTLNNDWTDDEAHSNNNLLSQQTDSQLDGEAIVDDEAGSGTNGETNIHTKDSEDDVTLHTDGENSFSDYSDNGVDSNVDEDSSHSEHEKYVANSYCRRTDNGGAHISHTEQSDFSNPSLADSFSKGKFSNHKGYTSQIVKNNYTPTYSSGHRENLFEEERKREKVDIAHGLDNKMKSSLNSRCKSNSLKRKRVTASHSNKKIKTSLNLAKHYSSFNVAAKRNLNKIHVSKKQLMLNPSNSDVNNKSNYHSQNSNAYILEKRGQPNFFKVTNKKYEVLELNSETFSYETRKRKAEIDSNVKLNNHKSKLQYHTKCDIDEEGKTESEVRNYQTEQQDTMLDTLKYSLMDVPKKNMFVVERNCLINNYSSNLNKKRHKKQRQIKS